MKNLSIKTRITIWYTAFLLLITGLFLAVLYDMGNDRAIAVAQARLMDSVDDVKEEYAEAGDPYITGSDIEFYEDGVYISIYDENKVLLEGRRPIELSRLPDFESGAVSKAEDSDGETWYIYDSRVDTQRGDVWVRGISKDLARSGTVDFIIKFAGVAFPLLMIIAAIGGYFITRHAFRPVREILETVEEIKRDGDISRRISVDVGDIMPKDEIHTMAITFNGMFDKLENAFDKEKQFTSDVSHELRTPLSVIISQSDYALEDESYQKKALEVINRESKRMAGLVSRLLTLARSDTGGLELQREIVDLSEMCESVVWQQQGVAAKYTMSVSGNIESDIKVWGDEAMLIRVLLNLTENAVKYGKEGGHIEVSLRKDEGNAVLTVTDDGIGIPEEEISKIWQRFYRVSSDRSREGTGLGLSMVQALVKAHGGSVAAESSEGKGSCFTVILPIYMGKQRDADNIQEEVK